MKKLDEHLPPSRVTDRHGIGGADVARLEATLESAGDGLIVTDIEGRVEFLNPVAERLIGVERPLAIGRMLGDLFRLHERLGGSVKGDLVQLAVMSGGTVGLGSDLILVPSGGGAPVEIEGEISVRTGPSTISGAVITFRDVTARHREELHRWEQQKIRAVGEFAGSVAHALNNLLTVILSHSEALHHRFVNDETVRLSTNEITRAGTEVRSIAGDLLALSGGFALKPTILDLNAVIERVRPRLHALLTGIELRISLAPDLGKIIADPEQLEQIIVEMTQYAKGRTSTGGKIEVASRNVTVDENCRATYLKRFVQVSVRDYGPDYHDDEVHGPVIGSWRPDSGPPRSSIDFLLAQAAITMARGHLTVEKPAGPGAVVVLSLPRYEEDPLLRSSTQNTRKDGTGWTVLLVEDDHAVRVLLRNGLEKHGFAVIEARDGAEAMEQASWHEGSIELLITDVAMPRISGPELARALASTRPEMKILFISGGPEFGAGIEDLVANGACVLAKPFSQRELLALVRSILTPVIGSVAE